MIASWSKTIQSALACGPRVLFLPTKQSARPIYSHDNATWKSSISTAGTPNQLMGKTCACNQASVNLPFTYLPTRCSNKAGRVEKFSETTSHASEQTTNGVQSHKRGRISLKKMYHSCVGSEKFFFTVVFVRKTQFSSLSLRLAN